MNHRRGLDRPPTLLLPALQQAVVDAQHKLIAAADVTNDETDWQQPSEMARQATENLGVERLDVAGLQGLCGPH